MLKTVKKVADIFLWVYSAVGLVALTLVIVFAFLQVVARYALPQAPTWTEEGARYAFIWMSMMGASAAARHCSNASVDLLDTLFRGKGKDIHFVILQFFILAAVIIIIPYGVEMVGQMMMRSSSALGIPMGYMYLSIPIGCVGIAVQSAYNILERIFGGKEEESWAH